MSEITAIVSGKGGAGKTMFAANMACLLAMKGRKVLLIDMNSGMRNLDICLGLENQVIFDLADVIDGICPLKKALVRDRRFRAMYLLSAPQIKGKTKVENEHMRRLCMGLADSFDNIIIDTPSCMGDNWDVSVSQADSAVLMLSQEFSSLRCTETLESLLNDHGISVRYAVINRVDERCAGEGMYPSFDDISRSTRAIIAGIIKDDPVIYRGMNSGEPAAFGRSRATAGNLKNICDRIF